MVKGQAVEVLSAYVWHEATIDRHLHGDVWGVRIGDDVLAVDVGRIRPRTN